MFERSNDLNYAGEAGTLAQLSLRNLGASSVQKCVKKKQSKNHEQQPNKTPNKNTKRQLCKIQVRTTSMQDNEFWNAFERCDVSLEKRSGRDPG